MGVRRVGGGVWFCEVVKVEGLCTWEGRIGFSSKPLVFATMVPFCSTVAQ